MIGDFKLSAGPFGREQLLRVSTIPGLRHRGRCRFYVHEGVPVGAQLAPRVPPALSKRCSTCVFWEFTELGPLRKGVHVASPQGQFSRVSRRRVHGLLELWRAFRGGPKCVFWSPPVRNCSFLAEAFKNPLRERVRAGTRTRWTICLGPARLHGGGQSGGLWSPAHKHWIQPNLLV